MTIAEIRAATKIAMSNVALSHYDDSVLHGCALPGFTTKFVELHVVARFLRDYINFNGTWDEQMLNDSVYSILKRKVRIV